MTRQDSDSGGEGFSQYRVTSETMRKQHETVSMNRLFGFVHFYREARRLEPFSDTELRLYLERSIKMARSARAKSRGLVGRLSGWFFGDEDKNYVELDGIAMIQLASMIPGSPNEELHEKSYYRLPLPVVCEVYERAFHGEIQKNIARKDHVMPAESKDENIEFAEKSKPPSMIWFGILWIIELYSLYRFFGGFYDVAKNGSRAVLSFRWDADVILFSILLWVSFGLLVLKLYRPSEIMDETTVFGGVVMAGLPIAMFLLIAFLVVFGVQP